MAPSTIFWYLWQIKLDALWTKICPKITETLGNIWRYMRSNLPPIRGTCVRHQRRHACGASVPSVAGNNKTRSGKPGVRFFGLVLENQKSGHHEPRFFGVWFSTTKSLVLPNWQPISRAGSATTTLLVQDGGHVNKLKWLLKVVFMSIICISWDYFFNLLYSRAIIYAS